MNIPSTGPTFRPTYQSQYRRRRYDDDDDDLRSSYESGVVGEDERAIERFAKDCAAGALRGLFYEAWQFFKNFRFR